MGDRPLRELVNMRWQETSGVDRPANQEEGWVLMKNSSQELIDLLMEEEDAISKSSDLASLLEDTDLSSAPRQVQTAAQVLNTYLTDEGVQKMGMYGHGYGKKKKKRMMASDKYSDKKMVEKALAKAWIETEIGASIAKALRNGDRAEIRRQLNALKEATQERLEESA